MALCDSTDFTCQAVAIENALSRAPASELLRRRYRIVIVGWADALALRTDAGKDVAQIELLQRALRADPSFGDAAVSLGVLLWRSGQKEEARAALEHASKLEATRARATALLQELANAPR